jgi:hypothetical protein
MTISTVAVMAFSCQVRSATSRAIAARNSSIPAPVRADVTSISGTRPSSN